MSKAKKQKVKRPHQIRRMAGMIAACLFLVVVIVANVAVSMLGDVMNSYLSSNNIDATNMESASKSARKLSKEAEKDSAVLLQNKENTLPLSSDVTKVNVFGWAATNWLGGGSGSGGVTQVKIDFLKSLEKYNISYNEELIQMYQNFQDKREYDRTLAAWPEQTARLYEPSISDANYYSQELLEDAKAYSDTAFVVVGRWNGESNDATQKQYKRTTKDGDIITDETKTQLELSTEEIELLQYVGENYKNVIVVLNTGNVMEMGQIESIPGVDACVMAGLTGSYGAEVLPELLWGEDSFSGKTVDTWAYDMASAASYANTAENGVGKYSGAEGLYPANGTLDGNLGEEYYYDQVSYVDYAEGIYVGYKWYETADTEHYWDNVSNEYGQGYEGVVQYPFGYGLSYTDFSWEVTKAPEDGQTITDKDTLSYKVKVTNTGKVSGKDVVELYYNPPYTAGGIEKASVNLAAFAKTDVLAPGESQEVTLTVDAADMASYDCYDANSNSFCGYELEAGDYELTLRKNAHMIADGTSMTSKVSVTDTICMDKDATTGKEVSNKFTGEDAIDGVSLDGKDSNQNITYLTRKDFTGTFPTENVDTRAMADNVKALNLYTADMANAWIDDSDKDIETGKDYGHLLTKDGKLTELGYQLGLNPEDEKWEEVLDQVSIKEMEALVYHAYAHTGEVKSVGKPATSDQDGPSQIGGFFGNKKSTGFPSSSTMACSWNAKLFEKVGLAIGKEAVASGVQGWYAPAVNIHRSPFNGRNYEYYSEDALLSGVACGNTVAGAKHAGVYCYVKHFICNDGESYIYRDSVYTWMSEQALREIYLEPFRMLVEEYDATGLMTSYNRIGAVWTGGSQVLLTGVLRDEWNFPGAVITDYSDWHEYMNGDQMLRAGGDLWMDGMVKGETTCETSSNSYKQALRQATKHTLYMYTNALAENANYANEIGDDSMISEIGNNSSVINKILIVMDVMAVVFMALGIMGVVKDQKLKKEMK